MLSRIPSFRDDDFQNITELPLEQSQCKLFFQSSLTQKPILDQTSFSDHQYFDDFHFSKSLFTTTRDYEISFQASFMNQHQNAFKKQIENFMESCFKFQTSSSAHFFTQEIFPNSTQRLPFLDDDEYSAKFQENGNFLKIIQHQQKLIQFLKFIYQTVHRELGAELTYLCSIVWCKHIAEKDIQQNEQQLAKKCKQLANKMFQELFYDERIKFLNLKLVSSSQLNSIQLIKDAFKNFLQFFFTTVVLVGEEFFSNPFAETQTAKRQRMFRIDDDEDNDPSSTNSILIGKPSKKLHFY